MRNGTTLFITILAGLGGILYGYDLGIIAGAFLFIKDSIALTQHQLEFLVGAVFFGGAISTLITGPLCDWFGRRIMIILSGAIFIVGVLMVAYATDYQMLLTGRLVQGIGVGIVTIAIPLYLAESIPPSMRGRGVSTFQLLLTVGILGASLIGLHFTPSGDWRGMFLSALVPGVIFFIGSFFLPESPRSLYRKGRFEQALKVLCRTRSEDEARHELEQMKIMNTSGQSKKSGHGSSIWQTRYMLPLGIVLCVACLQQLTGINSILQLSSVILKTAGLKSNIVAMLGSTAITGLNFVVTVVALLLIDKVGRRPLLCLGTLGMVIALAYSGFIFYLMPPSADTGFLLLIGILLFICFYAIGPGVIVWLVISELLPSRIRSTGMAVALFLNSMVSSLFATAYLGLASTFGYYGVFWLCSLFSLFYFLIAVFAVPETKNKTLEEIEAHFAHKQLS